METLGFLKVLIITANNNSSFDDDLILHKTEVRKGDFFYEVTHQDGDAANNHLIVFDGENYYINFESNFYKLTISDNNLVSFFVPKNDKDRGFLSDILGLGTALGTGLVLRNNTV